MALQIHRDNTTIALWIDHLLRLDCCLLQMIEIKQYYCIGFVAVLLLCFCKFVVTAGSSSVQRIHIHWKQTLWTLAAPELVKISTSSAAIDWNFVEITFFCFTAGAYGTCYQYSADPCDRCPLIVQGCFTEIRPIAWLTRCLWNNPEIYG